MPSMTKKQALRYFKNQRQMALAANVSPQAASTWKDCPPNEAQIRLEKASGGKLRADAAVIEFYRELLEGIERWRECA